MTAQQDTSRNVKNLDEMKFGARIKVVGVGGSGSNAVDHMINSGMRGVDFICVNCDTQDLHYNKAEKKIHIGKNLTRGLGAGMNPEVGRKAAEETKSEIQDGLKGADMVFITCGLGGGTGTGAAPIVAEAARAQGALTLAVVTKPFSFEGAERSRIAEDGLRELIGVVDTVIVIPNDRLLEISDKKTTLQNAFALCDDVLKNTVQGISELIVMPGIINLDFADVKTIMGDAGPAIVGIGSAQGDERAVEAARKAISSPLLDISIDGARGILFAVAGGEDLTLHEINEAAKIITESADPQAKIIFGAFHDDTISKGSIKITVIAAGFSNPGLNIIASSRHKVFDNEEREKEDEDDGDKSGGSRDEDMDTPAFMRRGKLPPPSEKKPNSFKSKKDDQRTHHSVAQMGDVIEKRRGQDVFFERFVNAQTPPRTSEMRDFYSRDIKEDTSNREEPFRERPEIKFKVFIKKSGEALFILVALVIGAVAAMIYFVSKLIKNLIQRIIRGR